MQRTATAEMSAIVWRRSNDFVQSNLKHFELLGVCMRIVRFGIMSWMGPKSPFLFIWSLNSLDAALLTWCAILRQDRAYKLLNGFWLLVGVVGVVRAYVAA